MFVTIFGYWIPWSSLIPSWYLYFQICHLGDLINLTSILKELCSDFEYILQKYSSEIRHLISKMYKTLCNQDNHKSLPYQKLWKRDCDLPLTKDVCSKMWSSSPFSFIKYPNMHSNFQNLDTLVSDSNPTSSH